MKKILIIISSILLLSSCSINDIITSNTNNTTSTKSNPGIIQKTENELKLEEIEKVKREAEERKQKIETIRKKLSIKGLILKGNIHYKNQDYTSALIKYLQIYREVPNDKVVINDLGKVYYNLKNFKKSYSYFSKIKDYEKLDKDLVAKTLISSVNFTTENIDYILEELNTLGLDEQQLFYYKNSVRCKQDFSYCKQKFQDYFTEEVETLSGKTIREIKYIPLKDIKTTLENYKNSQIDDLSYKGALVSGVYFTNGLYPLAIETSKDILKEKKDYRPLLKIVAKSYYELGDYIQAKIYLIKYNKLVDDDYEVSYFLGRVYDKLHEYILSTIHLQKALKIGYPDSLDINKRILLNYYELGEIDRMLDVFTKIINENYDQINETDYELAIYYHILNNKLDGAKEIVKKALVRYPKSEIFNGYMGWILMEENNEQYTEAEKYINKGLEINTKSPMVNLVKGKLEIKLGNIDKAFIYFKKTVGLDPEGDYGKIAKKELENIKVNKK